jgi:hypothetical protein
LNKKKTTAASKKKKATKKKATTTTATIDTVTSLTESESEPDTTGSTQHPHRRPRKKRKKKIIRFLDQRIGRNFDAATTDCLSLAVSETEAWKELIEYCSDRLNLDCPILPASSSSTLQEVKVIICKHFPGDNHFDEMTEDRSLWLTKDGYLGEICFCFLTSTINCTIYHTKDIQGNYRDSIAFTDINMCSAPNKCGGDHNHPKLQALTADVLIKTIRLCRNQKIVFLGKKPNQFAAASFLLATTKEGRISR